jgi:hypothetical protein
MHRLILPLLALCALGPAAAAENAALAKYGARIAITCDNPKPLNEHWAKAEDLLEDHGGPIINSLATGRVTLSFPVPLHVRQIGLALMGKKDNWARASQVEVRVGDKVIHTLTLDVDSTALQLLDIPETETDRLELVVKAVLPADAKTPYGGFSKLVAIVAEDVATRFAAPASGATSRPPMLMPTANLAARPPVAVIGKPRAAKGHPCTIWDAQDIAELKQQIATVPEAKDAYQRCLAFCEQACAAPVTVPDKPDEDTDKAVAAGHSRVVEAIANLGIGYALSGDERFAKEARRLLLRYADLYEGWPVHGSPNFKHDMSKWSWQRLGDAIWLIQAAWGFDLVHASPSLSDDDRARIRDHFVMPCVRQILSSRAIIAATTNWSAICCTAVMIGARVSGDEETYRLAIDGLPVPKNKKAPVVPGGPSGNNGGIYYYIDKGIEDDGMWAEGAIGYQFMAMRGLVVMAEILWHDGVDVWGYRNGRLKLIFDSPIWYHYPGGRTSPAVHDSGSTSLFGRDAHLYQYAARRYGDKTYNAILSRIAPSLASIYNQFLPAFDFAPVEAMGLPPVPSVLFTGVGFATARTGEGDDSRYLMVDYGPNRSHGHPDKLNHCFFALGEELFADGGSAWYSTDVYRQYYDHTLAHNTVLANGQRQIDTGGTLRAFCQAGDLALIRATCDSAIPATGLDRTLVLLGDRLYDVYQVRSAMAQTFDLPYHSGGVLAAEGPLAASLAPWADPDREHEGYTWFGDPRAAVWDGDWTCAWTVKRGTMRMHAIGEPASELVFATTPKGGSKLGALLLRRKVANTVFATVCDLIPTGRQDSLRGLKALRGEGGYGLEAELADGAKERVLVNYGAAGLALGEWKTDAGAAAVRQRGTAVEALVLSGGTSLAGPGLAIHLSAAGQISAYAVKDGLIRASNHGDAEITVEWAGLAATQAAVVDAAGAWTGRTPITAGRFAIPAHGAVDLSNGGDETVAAYESAQRRAKQQAAWEGERKRLATQAAEAAARLEAAKREPVPPDYVVLIEAETPSAQGGGEVIVTDKKAATHGTSITQWNGKDHWLEYGCEVAHTGWYQLGLKYCLEGDEAVRAVRLDGEYLDPSLTTVALPGTGGWSNGADQWSLVPVCLPDSSTPMIVRLVQGKHVIRLESPAGGGLNLDYLVLAPATATLSRAMVEK